MKLVATSRSVIGGRDRQRDRTERVIRVDSLDRPRGSAGKLDVHREGLLHRAFSVFVFNAAGELLMQRRADCKYHFAGLWSNTCCGHPRPGESTAAAAARRLREELGISVPLSEQTALVYRARDSVSGLIEHEYLHVFRGELSDGRGGEPHPDPDEVGAWQWVSIPDLRQCLADGSGAFTPWFALLFQRVCAPEASAAGG